MHCKGKGTELEDHALALGTATLPAPAGKGSELGDHALRRPSLRLRVRGLSLPLRWASCWQPRRLRGLSSVASLLVVTTAAAVPPALLFLPLVGGRGRADRAVATG